MKKKKEPVYFHAEPDDIARLKAIAEREEISYSEALRRTISEYVERHGEAENVESLVEQVLKKDGDLRELLEAELRRREAVERRGETG